MGESLPPHTIQRIYMDSTRDGDVETLRQVLSNPKNSILRNVNILDEKKLTPLHYAARHSNIEAMKILVEHGADVNKLGDDDMTPLHYVSRYGKNVVPKELKRKSSITPLMTPMLNPEDDPDVGGSRSITPALSDVVKSLKSHVAKVDTIIEYLVEHGADINAQDKYGMSPLHHTAIRGNYRDHMVILRLIFGVNLWNLRCFMGTSELRTIS